MYYYYVYIIYHHEQHHERRHLVITIIIITTTISSSSSMTIPAKLSYFKTWRFWICSTLATQGPRALDQAKSLPQWRVEGYAYKVTKHLIIACQSLDWCWVISTLEVPKRQIDFSTTRLFCGSTICWIFDSLSFLSWTLNAEHRFQCLQSCQLCRRQHQIFVLLGDFFWLGRTLP